LIAVCVSNAWSNSFAYDGKMRKRIERDYAWMGSAWEETNEVHYVYDGNLVVQERWFNPQVSTQNPVDSITYTRGTDLGGSLQRAGGIGGLLARTDNSKLAIGDSFASAFYHADGNGNVTALMYSSQMLAAKYLYDPYGNTLAMSGPLASANHYRFSSKEWNDNDGLYYYGYRFYDPSLQRWPNRDPFGELGFETAKREKARQPVIWGLFRKDVILTSIPNQFEFVQNSPLFEIDLFGLCNCEAELQRCKSFIHVPNFTDTDDNYEGCGRGIGWGLEYSICYASYAACLAYCYPTIIFSPPKLPSPPPPPLGDYPSPTTG